MRAATGPSSLDADRYFRCFALVSGRCWLVMEGVNDPVRLSAGEFVVLPHGRAFRVASDLNIAPGGHTERHHRAA